MNAQIDALLALHATAGHGLLPMLYFGMLTVFMVVAMLIGSIRNHLVVRAMAFEWSVGQVAVHTVEVAFKALLPTALLPELPASAIEPITVVDGEGWIMVA